VEVKETHTGSNPVLTTFNNKFGYARYLSYIYGIEINKNKSYD
jgi:hypothetical protein